MLALTAPPFSPLTPTLVLAPGPDVPGHWQVPPWTRHTQVPEPLLRSVPQPGTPFPLSLIQRCSSYRKPPRLVFLGLP